MKNEINIPAVHPGLVLKDELEEIGITQNALAEHIGVLPKISMRFVVVNEASALRWHGNCRRRSGRVRTFDSICKITGS